jgi:dTDP-glucose 4,6-dehydratase
MRNFLITGGAGFIGSNFVIHLLNKYPEYNVVVYDKLTYAGNRDNLLEVSDNPRFYFVKGDICDFGKVAETVERYDVDVIVNFAAETHVDRSIMDPGAFMNTNVQGTYVLLEAARNFEVDRYHQISTDEVYGDVPKGYSSVEGDTVAPRSPYARMFGVGNFV